MRREILHKRAVVLLLLVATVVPLQMNAAPHRKHATREQIIDLEQQWRQAELNLDVPAMDKLLSDDYLGITGAGEVLTKAQQLDHMRSRQIAITSLEISDIKVKLIGQIAIVNSQAKLKGLIDGHPIDGSYRYTRVYQHHLPTGSWKITSFEATRILSGKRASELPASAAAAPAGAAPAGSTGQGGSPSPR